MSNICMMLLSSQNAFIYWNPSDYLNKYHSPLGSEIASKYEESWDYTVSSGESKIGSPGSSLIGWCLFHSTLLHWKQQHALKEAVSDYVFISRGGNLKTRLRG